MKDWIKELCPEIADWQAELIAEHCQPKKREWQGLTYNEIEKLRKQINWTAGWSYFDFARAIEAKLKEKNT